MKNLRKRSGLTTRHRLADSHAHSLARAELLLLREEHKLLVRNLAQIQR